jgi:hypothetical protein
LAESQANPDLGKRLWEEKIEKALQASNVVLVLWTQNAASSMAVSYEIDRARKLGKRIIPAVENSSSPPESLRDLVYVRFDQTNQIEALKTILRTLLDYESEVGQQQTQEFLGFLGLLAILGVAGAALSSKS